MKWQTPEKIIDYADETTFFTNEVYVLLEDGRTMFGQALLSKHSYGHQKGEIYIHDWFMAEDPSLRHSSQGCKDFDKVIGLQPIPPPPSKDRI